MPSLDELAAYFQITTAEDALWFGIGVSAQLAFTMRFLIQWIASERAGRSIVPVAFWYFSLGGGIVLFVYGLQRGEPVILLGQSFGIVVYLRNIWLIHAERRRERERLSVSLPPRPLRAAGETAQDGRWAAIALGVIAGLTLLRLITLALQGYPLLGDEAQYWTWAQAPDWGYYSKPPMVAWAIAAAEAVCGGGVACLRAPATLSYAVGAAFVFLLGRRLFGARVGAWAAIVYATLPGVSFSALLVTTDPFLLMFWAVGLYAVHRAATEGDGLRWWAVAGVAVGLGLLSKYAMIAFPLSLGLWALVDPAARAALRARGVLLAAAIAGAIFAPNLLWNAAQDWPTLGHTADNANFGASLFNPENLLKFFGEQFGVFGPLLMAALLALLVTRPAAIWRDGRMRFLILFATPILLIMLGQSFISRAHANWAAPAYVAATLLVAGALLTRAPKLGRGLLSASIALHVVVAAAAYAWDAWAPAAGLADARFDPYQHQRGWDGLGAATRAALDAHPDARLLSDHRMTLASLVREARPPLDDFAKWNPRGTVLDHYEMTTDIAADVGADFVFVTRSAVDAVAARFDAATLIRTYALPRPGGRTRAYRIYLLEGFRGYAPVERVKGIEPSS